MLYTVAKAAWTPASPPGSAAGRVFVKTRAEAIARAQGRTILAIALCYDPTRSTVYSRGDAPGGAWSAPALVDHEGRLTILAPVPAHLATPIGRPTFRVHPGPCTPRPALATPSARAEYRRHGLAIAPETSPAPHIAGRRPLSRDRKSNTGVRNILRAFVAARANEGGRADAS